MYRLLFSGYCNGEASLCGTRFRRVFGGVTLLGMVVTSENEPLVKHSFENHRILYHINRFPRILIIKSTEESV